MKSVGCWPSFGLMNILRSSRHVQMFKMYASRKRAWQRQTRRQCLYLHLFPNTEFTVAMLIFPISDDLYSRGARKVDARVWHQDGCLVSPDTFLHCVQGCGRGQAGAWFPSDRRYLLHPAQALTASSWCCQSHTITTTGNTNNQSPNALVAKKATNRRSSDKHNHLTQSDCKYHQPEGQEAIANSTGGQVRRYTCRKVLIIIQDFNVQLLRMKP